MNMNLPKKIACICGALVLIALIVLRSPSFFHIQKQISSKKGIEWLIKQQTVVGPEVGGLGYLLIYKVTPDTLIANRLSDLLTRKTSGVTHDTTIILEQDYTENALVSIESTAGDLLKEQCMGIDNTGQVDKLKNIFLLNKNDIQFAIPRSAGAMITILYFLKKIGISDEGLRDLAIAHLKQADIHYREDVYGLTHIMLTDSDFLDRYLDPADYRREIELFNAILTEFASKKTVTPSEVDMLSEVIVCLKLLGQDTNTLIPPISRKIIAMQNNDGSWDSNFATDPYHTTVVATLAIMDFTKNLRSTGGFCSPK